MNYTCRTRAESDAMMDSISINANFMVQYFDQYDFVNPIKYRV